MLAQRVRRSSAVPDVKDLLDEADAAGLVTRFSLSTPLRYFIERWLGMRLAREGVTDVYVESVGISTSQATRFGFYLIDATGPVTVVREAGAVMVQPDRYAITDAEVNTDVVSPEEFVELVRSFSSAVYSAVMALLDSLPNSPMCARDHHCLGYVKELRDVLEWTFDRVGLYPPVDPEVYERVKDVVERGGLPFKSEAEVDWEDHEKVVAGLLGVAREVDRRVGKVRVFAPGDGSEQDLSVSLTLDLSSPSIVLVVGDAVSLSLMMLTYSEGSHLAVTSKLAAPYPHYSSTPPEVVSEVFARWYDFTVWALERVVKQLEAGGGGLPPKVSEAVVAYLRAWLDVLPKYKRELEKNKKFSELWS
ncbi:MAG: hypothetical protein QW512_02100 [Thermofilaceae archaeon]